MTRDGGQLPVGKGLIARRGWATNLLLVIVSAIGALLVLEAGTRLFGLTPASGPFDPNVPDAELGMSPRRSYSQKADFKEHQGVLIQQTNNLGFYQRRDTALAPTPGVERVVALGDSFTAGATNAEESFPGVLERLLNEARPDRPVEMLNAGAGRYSPYQCYVRLERRITPLQPKHVLMAVYVGNDFLDMIRRDDRPYLTELPDGSFQAHGPRFVSYRDPSEEPGLLDKSRVWAVFRGFLGPTIQYRISRVKILRDNLSSFGYGTGAILQYVKQVAELDRVGHGLMLQILNQQLWFEHFPETLPLSLKINRRTMQLFRDLCQKNGVRLTYTVIPSKDMIEPERLQAVMGEIQKKSPRTTLEKLAAFDERLTDETMRSCRELGVEYIDLRAGLRSRRKGAEFFYPDDMHMNPAGNRAVAETLAGALLADMRDADVGRNPRGRE
jgi:lysophospholipase L1-like esterase